MLGRLVLGYLLALLPIVPQVARWAGGEIDTLAVVAPIRLVLWSSALWISCVLLVWAVERSLRRLAPRVSGALLPALTLGRLHPRIAVAGAALLATAIATYPVLLLGRSFVAPNTGGTPQLYGEPPYAPGSSDSVLEDTRGSDIWATTLQCVPYSRIQRSALAHGEIPLWNRYNAIGRPLWGQGLAFLLDPLHWFTLITPDLALGWDLKFVAHRFTFAAGVGFAALAATGAWVPSVIVAAVAPFSGIYAYRLSHPAVFALTYAPWVLLAWFRLAEAIGWRQRVRACIQLVVSSSLVLFAATPKEGVITLLAVEAAGALAIWFSPGGWREFGKRLASAAIAGVAVTLITAPQWLIFLDTLAGSVTLYDTPKIEFAGMRQAVGLFLSPLVPGTPTVGLNLVAGVFVIAAFTAPIGQLQRPKVIACSLVGAVLLALAFGAVPAIWFLGIPYLDKIGHVDDVFVAAAIPLILIVSAFGAECCLAAGRRRAAILAAATGAFCFCLALGLGAVTPSSEFVWWAALLLLPLAAALPVCLAARCTSRRVVPGMAAIAAGTVLLLPGGLHGTSGIEPLDRLLLQPRLRATLDQTSPAVDAVHGETSEPRRAVGLEWVLLAGSQALYDLEGVAGVDPLEVGSYRELIDASGMLRLGYWLTLVRAGDLERLAPLLDMLNAGFLLTSGEAPPGSGVLTMRGADRVRAFRRESAWPRAFLVDGVTRYTRPGDLLQRVTESGQPFAAIQAGDDDASRATRQLVSPSRQVVPASDYALTVNSTRFRVKAPGPGIAVLGETFLPNDFIATLNGREVEYFRVNHVFKGVRVPGAGDWEIRFEYRPEHWAGAWRAAAAGGAILLVAIVLVTPRIRFGAGSKEYPAASASS